MNDLRCIGQKKNQMAQAFGGLKNVVGGGGRGGDGKRMVSLRGKKHTKSPGEFLAMQSI